MKSIGPTTPYGYTIFCDDIRREAGNKTSHMGIYGSTIEIAKPLPFTFPKFCFSVTYVERPGESTEPVELRIYLPEDPEDAPTFKTDVPIEQMRTVELPASRSSGDLTMQMGMNLMLTPLVLKETGLIRVRAYRGDLEVRLGTIRVNAPPPAEKDPTIEDESATPASPA